MVEPRGLEGLVVGGTVEQVGGATDGDARVADAAVHGSQGESVAQHLRVREQARRMKEEEARDESAREGADGELPLRVARGDRGERAVCATKNVLPIPIHAQYQVRVWRASSSSTVRMSSSPRSHSAAVCALAVVLAKTDASSKRARGARLLKTRP
jgi:hypothetical protein